MKDHPPPYLMRNCRWHAKDFETEVSGKNPNREVALSQEPSTRHTEVGVGTLTTGKLLHRWE